MQLKLRSRSSKGAAEVVLTVPSAAPGEPAPPGPKCVCVCVGAGELGLGGKVRPERRDLPSGSRAAVVAALGTPVPQGPPRGRGDQDPPRAPGHSGQGPRRAPDCPPKVPTPTQNPCSNPQSGNRTPYTPRKAPERSTRKKKNCHADATPQKKPANQPAPPWPIRNSNENSPNNPQSPTRAGTPKRQLK